MPAYDEFMYNPETHKVHTAVWDVFE